MHGIFRARSEPSEASLDVGIGVELGLQQQKRGGQAKQERKSSLETLVRGEDILVAGMNRASSQVTPDASISKTTLYGEPDLNQYRTSIRQHCSVPSQPVDKAMKTSQMPRGRRPCRSTKHRIARFKACTARNRLQTETSK